MKIKIAWGVILFTIFFLVGGLIEIAGIGRALTGIGIVVGSTALLSWSIITVIDK